MKHKDKLALAIIQENGKPLNAARIDVEKYFNNLIIVIFRGIQMVEYCCNINNLI